MDETANMMRLYEKLLGEYPFKKEKYGYVMAPIGGGMENQTMTMISATEYSLLSHELAHSWFGNLVTCYDWQNVWVNEGLASYMEYVTLQNLKPREAPNWLKKAYSHAISGHPYSLAIPENEISNEYRIFDYDISYKKGAAMCHMLRKELNNDTVFFNILRTYLKQFAFKNASVEDFKKVLENVSGKNFDIFFNEWYYGKGYPQFSITWQYKHDTLTIESFQHGSSEETPLFHTTMACRIKFFMSDTIVRLNQTEPLEVYRFKCPRHVRNVIFDPNNIVLKELKVEKENDNQSFSINSFNDSISLTFQQNNNQRHLSVFNNQGHIIEEMTTLKDSETIYTANWETGMYYIKIVENGNTSIIKTVKKNK